jgi:hypothetical protein
MEKSNTFSPPISSLRFGKKEWLLIAAAALLTILSEVLS